MTDGFGDELGLKLGGQSLEKIRTRNPFSSKDTLERNADLLAF